MSFNDINGTTGSFNIKLFTWAKGNNGNYSFLPYLANFYNT